MRGREIEGDRTERTPHQCAIGDETSNKVHASHAPEGGSTKRRPIELIDLARALDFLNRELGVERLLLEGGVVNGSFLRTGLIDEVSVIVWPVVDGAAGAPCVFDSTPEDADQAAPLRAMQLLHAESMSDGSVWLRYRLENQA